MLGKNEIDNFWKQKEKETNSKLIIATVASYLKGYELHSSTITGLLYLMENGVYFENFEDSPNIMSFITKKKEFEKVTFKIAAKDIISITDFYGLKSQNEMTFVNKLIKALGFRNRGLIIKYNTSISDEVIEVFFSCFVNPFNIIKKYNSLSI